MRDNISCGKELAFLSFVEKGIEGLTYDIKVAFRNNPERLEYFNEEIQEISELIEKRREQITTETKEIMR